MSPSHLLGGDFPRGLLHFFIPRLSHPLVSQVILSENCLLTPGSPEGSGEAECLDKSRSVIISGRGNLYLGCSSGPLTDSPHYDLFLLRYWTSSTLTYFKCDRHPTELSHLLDAHKLILCTCPLVDLILVPARKSEVRRRFGEVRPNI